MYKYGNRKDFGDSTVGRATITFVILLIVSGLISNYTIIGAYGKHKNSNNGSNAPLPTENHQSSTQETKKVLKEYTDMPVDSPLFIASHSKHTNKLFGDTSLDLAGEIKNNGTDTAESVQVIATFYNANNVTLGNDFAYTQPDTIEPGQSAAYTINVGSGDGVSVNDLDHIKYHIEWQ